MISVLCAVFLVGLIICTVCIVRGCKYGFSSDGTIALNIVFEIIFAIFTAVFLIWTLILIHTVGTAGTIDRKITMYQEQNNAIEESIDATVKNYMDYESGIYENLKDEDGINLISLFPELKSDILVQKQIEVYISNNDKIKSLNEEKIDVSKARWNLYFGR